ncbi:hypothetical protein AB0O86_20070 [Streptomyces hirsutus]|uniref:hypothetical protein n=1 Tax=Streptomyces hirsutus TaxID=35620 RepID=UPI003432A897
MTGGRPARRAGLTDHRQRALLAGLDGGVHNGLLPSPTLGCGSSGSTFVPNDVSVGRLRMHARCGDRRPAADHQDDPASAADGGFDALTHVVEA